MTNELLQAIAAKIARIRDTPKWADAQADAAFPADQRDRSRQNALRHALGTGALTQELGGGPLAAGVAKLAGYGWEAMGAGDMNNPYHRRDTLHDLNANAVGAATAQTVPDREALLRVLTERLLASPAQSPPGFFSPTPGRLTYDALPPDPSTRPLARPATRRR